eukprot:1178736-Pleurochrysis_carterae.AAC.1
MHALYHPQRRGSGEPSERVRPDADTLAQLHHHARLVASSGGAQFSAALHPDDARNDSDTPRQVVSLYADAATDSEPPGMGGYCHGTFWYLHLTPLH